MLYFIGLEAKTDGKQRAPEALKISRSGNFQNTAVLDKQPAQISRPSALTVTGYDQTR